jgi:beta-glucosidase-like glycosyl hydrolase
MFRENADYKKLILELVKIGCGGFCIFEGNTISVSKAITELQMYAEIPLLFCADFENGLQMRLSDGTSFPHHYALGKTDNYTEKISNAIAKESKNIGIYWNLAPVCDINSNHQNPVINVRSFGENKNIVSKNVVDYINGLHSQNIASCAKHFPGHGDTATDSHIALPIIAKTLKELEQNEIIPFINAIKSGIKSIMLGHLLVKDISELPISLSCETVKYLRDNLVFNGIILTDALDMNSITDIYGDTASLLAFKAGVDVILMPPNPMLVIEQISDLLNEKIFSEQIECSLDRIYNLKRWTKLIPQYTQVEVNPKLFTEHLQLALKAAIQATTVSPPDTKLLPIDEEKPYSAFAIIQRDEDMQAASRFFTMLAQATENDCIYGYLDENITEDELNNMKDGIAESEFLLFALYYKGRGHNKQLASYDKIKKIISELSNGRKYIVMFFGDPYISEKIDANAKILTYSDSFASLASVVMLLSGRKLE